MFTKLGCRESAEKANIMKALRVNTKGKPIAYLQTPTSFRSNCRQIWMCSLCAMSMLVCITMSPISLKMREKWAWPM